MSQNGTDTPVLDLLARMTADSVGTSGLDAQTVALVRIAALVASDAPAVSYAQNLAAAGEVGLDAEIPGRPGGDRAHRRHVTGRGGHRPDRARRGGCHRGGCGGVRRPRLPGVSA